MEHVTETQLMSELRKHAAQTGQSALAREIGISPQLMCDVLKERRRFGSRVLDFLGYNEVITYVRKRRSR